MNTQLHVLACAVLQAAVSALLSMLIALWLVYWASLCDARQQRIMIAVAALFSMLSTTLVAMSVPFVGMAGIICTHVIINAPFAVCLLYLAHQKIDDMLVQCAHDLGASVWQCYRTIVLPLMRSAIITTSVIIFLLCFSSYSPIRVLATQWFHYTPSFLASLAYKQGDWYQALSYSLLRLIVVIPLCFVQGKKMCVASLHAVAVRDKKAVSGMQYWCGVVCAVLLVLPVGWFIVQRINSDVFLFWYHVVCAQVDELLGVPVARVIGNSVLLALCSSIGSVCIGFVLCWFSWRSRNAWARVCFGPLALLPSLIGGVGLGLLFIKLSSLLFITPFVGAVLCHVILNYPYAYRAFYAQMAMYQSEWVLTAYSMGATKWQRIVTIDVPFLKSAFVQAWILSFGLSLTEVGVGSILNGSAGITLPMAIHTFRDQGCIARALGLSLIVQLITLCAAFAVQYIKKPNVSR